jgi:regulator of CtrA degradation
MEARAKKHSFLAAYGFKLAESITEHGDRAMSDGSESVVAFSDAWSSKAFMPLYLDGMKLIEDARDYLTGDGPRECGLLPLQDSLKYSLGSMKLTTALLYCASWLLEQRALHEGETLTAPHAPPTQYRCADFDGIDALPEAFKGFLARTDALGLRISRLDPILNPETEAPTPSM